jgi:RNA 3'-terminal phosphate cyclase
MANIPSGGHERNRVPRQASSAVGIRAEVVAERAVKEMRRYLAAGAPVGPHLADQLLLPMALAGHGAFRTSGLSSHSRTNLAVIRMFSPTRISVAGDRDDILVEWGG